VICAQCAVGAYLNSKGDPAAKHSHELCKGCDCQHKLGSGWVKVIKKAPTTEVAGA
jgi:hypothetical protein